jgi:hypothetical protein
VTRPRVALLFVVVLLVGCGTTMKRDLEVEGALPRVIGLGAFAPSCLLLCFVTSDTRQGDVIREEIADAPLTIHRTESDEFKAGRKKSPPHIGSSRPRLKGPEPPPAAAQP